VQEHVLAAIIRRDETKASRVIEKFDRPGLAHGKLLSPFTMIRVLPATRTQSNNSKVGGNNRALS
jgi:hypothetical protein